MKASKYKKIMAKLHPDRNDTDTTKLAQMVSEAKETILKNDFNVDFHLDSSVQKMDLQKETPYLLEHLRKELNNGSIQIHLHVSELENQKISQLTSRERFFQMAEKNPDLHLFKEEFDLDLEY